MLPAVSRLHLVLSVFAWFAAAPAMAWAQPAPAPPPPSPACVDIAHSPDYVPGVDASARKVAPADLPSNGDLNVNPYLYVVVPTGKAQAPNAGVTVDASAILRPKPPCPLVSADGSVSATPR
jgi:hypothetical protein